MILETINFSKDFSLVQHKRQRSVFFNPQEDKYYKIWGLDLNIDPNFGMCSVVENCINVGFYDEEIAGCFDSLIVSKDRINFLGGNCFGYVTHAGTPFKSKPVQWTDDHDKFYLAADWSDVVKNTNEFQRHSFIKKIIHNTLKYDLVFFDMGPSNVILFKDRLSLIDLEACASSQKTLDQLECGLSWEDNISDYGTGRGKFKLPYENSKRDFNLFLFSYLFQCLGIKHKTYIDKIDQLQEVYDKL